MKSQHLCSRLIKSLRVFVPLFFLLTSCNTSTTFNYLKIDKQDYSSRSNPAEFLNLEPQEACQKGYKPIAGIRRIQMRRMTMLFTDNIPPREEIFDVPDAKGQWKELAAKAAALGGDALTILGESNIRIPEEGINKYQPIHAGAPIYQRYYNNTSAVVFRKINPSEGSTQVKECLATLGL